MASVLSTTTSLQHTQPTSPSHRGRYESLAGTRVYVTGPANSRKAVIDVHDAFSLSPSSKTSLEAADALASELGALVIVPDLSPRASEDFLSQVRGELGSTFEFMSAASAEALGRWPEVDAWGVYGLSGGDKDVQVFYNPLAVLLYIQFTVAAAAGKMEA